MRRVVYCDKLREITCKNLGESLTTVLDMLENLDGNNFSELNPDAEFDFYCLPIPISNVKNKNSEGLVLSQNVMDEFDILLNKINTENTNIEYPYLLIAEDGKEYNKVIPFEAKNKQTCTYNWEFIEEYIKNCNDNVKIALFHTHPNPLNEEHQTLYNQNKEILEKFNVQPNGLNISMADVTLTLNLQNIVNKHNKSANILTESVILMHDSNLIAFSTQNNLQLTHNQSLQKTKENLQLLNNIEPLQKKF